MYKGHLFLLDVSNSEGLTGKTYQKLWQWSVEDSTGFWRTQAKRLDWIKPYTKVDNVSFDTPVSIKWFEDGTLNASVNCLDRHLEHQGDSAAIIWEADNPDNDEVITYRELHRRVCKLANAMRGMGVKKGDRVCIYMPMIPETTIAMLACARIGAIHTVVFGGFSSEALADRINDSACRMLITADEGVRGTKRVPLKANVDAALEKNCPSIKDVLVVKRTGKPVNWVDGRDTWYDEATAAQSHQCSPEEMNAEDPLFILYTSGSTGKPKGVVHTTGGYLVYAAMTHHYVFDYKKGDVYWCTADIGWITGHTYGVYGPLANGAQTLMYEGVPDYPDGSRFWKICDRHKVNIFYTSPTVLRTLMREGDDMVTSTCRSSLRVLATVGEPIDPGTWHWYHDVVGAGRCPVVDTWWQTETGGVLIAPLPGITPLKPGSAALPFFGVLPQLVDREGRVLDGVSEGNLCIQNSWPGQMRTLYGDHERFEEVYFHAYKGKYFTGDTCRRDEDGYYWFTGRVDDVINVSGHRISTTEVENALLRHEDVSEVAVVGSQHKIKGQGIYAYVTLNHGVIGSSDLKVELIHCVRKYIGAIACPDWLQWAPALPKTRSGKIMRRILRNISDGNLADLGDTSTLAEPAVLEELINASKRLQARS